VFAKDSADKFPPNLALAGFGLLPLDLPGGRLQLSRVLSAQQFGRFVARFEPIRRNHALSLLVDGLFHKQASHFVADVHRLLFDVIKSSPPVGETVRAI
jgi:hypothetical protein